MDVLFLGDSDAPLLGAYHRARSGVDRGIGVVLAYPFGQEYMRAHRALRLLAQALTARGVHVMRVDYRGTGTRRATSRTSGYWIGSKTWRSRGRNCGTFPGFVRSAWSD